MDASSSTLSLSAANTQQAEREHLASNTADNDTCNAQVSGGYKATHAESASLEEDQSKPKMSKRALKRMRQRQQRERVKNEDFQTRSKAKIRKPRNKALNFEEDCLAETSYYFENGLRKVYPYYFKFSTYVKRRWIGEKILDVFLREFRNDTPENYKRCIDQGKLTVNGRSVTTDYRLRDNDFLSHTVHRHEVAVTDARMDILEDSDELLVINKPSSIPIHPCGRYRHNSIIFILAKENQHADLRTIYRLDRLTSGVLIFCKNEEKTRQLQAQIRDRLVQKEYLCRVQGEFPSEPVECSEPIDVLSHKVGLFKCGSGGKEAKTVFHRLSTDGATSLVKCQPLTGRTHQIRVHLQYLGFPIVNDPLYTGSVWGPRGGKAGDYGKADEELVEELLALHKAENYISQDGSEGGNVTAVMDNMASEFKDQSEHISTNMDTVLSGNTGVTSTNKYNNDDSVVDSTSGLHCDTPRETRHEQSHGLTTATLHETMKVNSQLPLCTRCDTDLTMSRNVSDSSNVVSPGATGSTPEVAAESNLPLDGASDAKKLKLDPDAVNLSHNTGTDKQTVDDRPGFDPAKLTVDAACRECKVAYKDPNKAELTMYLHAYSYKGQGWEFTTPLPDWAKEDWQAGSS